MSHHSHDGKCCGQHRHEHACGCGHDHHHPHDHHHEQPHHHEGDGKECCCHKAASGDGAGEDSGEASGEGDGDDDPSGGHAAAAHDRPEPRHDHSHFGRAHTGHAHPGHSHDHHGISANADSERRLLIAIALTAAFMVIEVAGAMLSGSLALLADAGHMFTDTASLALAWTAFRLGRRPADQRHSFGWRRFEVLAAYTNGIALFAIGGWIVVEAVQRLIEPSPVLAGEMMVIAAIGLAVNIAAFLILHGGDRENMNVRGALLHVSGDLLGSAAAIAAAGAILATGWTPIDPILSVLVAGLILRGAISIVRDSAHILMEGAPQDYDESRMSSALRELPNVIDVHHLHTWCLTTDRRLATLHAVIGSDTDDETTLSAIKDVLRTAFGIDHATVQIERTRCPDRPLDLHHDRGACGA